MGRGFQPVAIRERIQTLDVVRGFALLGIALMNVEFFNRPLAAIGDGLPAESAGMDAWSGLLIHLLVRGKFYVLFSLLFGAGFALMLARAQAAGRPFKGTYLRRTLALALFGLGHGILLWAGDILLSYACAAALLLVVLFARGWAMWLAFATLIALGFVAGNPEDAGFTSLILLLDAVVLALLRRGGAPGQALQGPRLLRAGVMLYLLPALLMLLAGGAAWMAEARSQNPNAHVDSQAVVSASQADRNQQVAALLAQHARVKAEETQVMSRARYAEVLAYRAPAFLLDFLNGLFFVGIAMGLFMIGAWLLQSGALVDPARHQALYRGFVLVALPVGLALCLVSTLTATGPASGQGRWLFAQGMLFAGGLPLALGYLGALVLALQHVGMARWLRWLAPAGRMALTNYIGQSLVCALFFYGHGLGNWGLPRTQQLLFVLVMFTLQLAASHWWLAHFRYGPLEWLWRWATYGQRPVLRSDA